MEGCKINPNSPKIECAAVTLEASPALKALDPHIFIDVGKLNARYSKLFLILGKDPSLQFQAFLMLHGEQGHNQKSKFKASRADMPRMTLSCNLYGPMSSYDRLGEFLYCCYDFLQPPFRCDRNVPYRNPQSLTGLDPNPPMTMDVSWTAQPLNACFETLGQVADPSAALETSTPLLEMEAPKSIRTPFFR